LQQAADFAAEQKRLEIGLRTKLLVDGDDALGRERGIVRRIAELSCLDTNEQRAPAGAHMNAAIGLLRNAHVHES